MTVQEIGPDTYRLFWELPRGIDGKRRRESAIWHGDSKSAQVEWRRRQAEIDAGTHTEPSRMTLRELTERWLRDVKSVRVESSTLGNYGTLLRVHILPDLGHLRVQRVQAADLQAYYRMKLSPGGRRDGKAGGLSPRTVRYLHTLLVAIFSQAVRWDILQRNPAELAEPPEPSEQEMHFWGAEEAARFVGAVLPHRLGAMWALAIVTGLRQGELLGLRWREVDLKGGSVTVARAMKRGKGERFGPPKSRRSRRTVTLDGATVALLRQHRVRQAEERLAAGEAWQDSGLVFTTREGRPLMPRNILRLHYQLCAKAGVPTIRFHDLRHTNATILFDRGTDPKTVQARLGHHSVSFTLQKYVHAMQAREQEAAQSIGDAVLGGGDQRKGGKKKPSA